MSLQIAQQHKTTGEHILSLKESVKTLLKLANMNCGASEVAANILLSTYNFYDYPLNLSGLCLLDENYYQHAINVIGIRCRLGIEPHTLIFNGDLHFQRLAFSWHHLKTTTIH